MVAPTTRQVGLMDPKLRRRYARFLLIPRVSDRLTAPGWSTARAP
jgi:hypothetical protein